MYRLYRDLFIYKKYYTNILLMIGQKAFTCATATINSFVIDVKKNIFFILCNIPHDNGQIICLILQIN